MIAFVELFMMISNLRIPHAYSKKCHTGLIHFITVYQTQWFSVNKGITNVSLALLRMRGAKSARTLFICVLVIFTVIP
jgi:hypothetical protein